MSSIWLVFQGLSFLDLRYQLLLFYLQDLTHLISLKTEGAKIKESQAMERVMTVRTVRSSTPNHRDQLLALLVSFLPSRSLVVVA